MKSVLITSLIAISMASDLFAKPAKDVQKVANIQTLQVLESGFFGTVTSGAPNPVLGDLPMGGTTLYVANCTLPGSIGVLDASVPYALTYIGKISSGGNNPTAMFFNGTTGYVANYLSNTVGVFDVSVPGTATLIGAFNSGGFNPWDFATDITGTTTGFVANNSSPGIIGIFDISVPGTAHLVGTVFAGGANVNRLFSYGTTLYCANVGNNTIGVLDISVPGSATFKGTIPSGGSFPLDFINNAPNGTTGYITNVNSDSIGVFDMSIPGSASFIGKFSSGGRSPQYTYQTGTTAFVGNYLSKSVGVFDMSIPGTGTLLGVVDSGGFYPFSIITSGTFGYVCNQLSGNVGIFDTTNPGSVTFVDQFSSGDAWPTFFINNGSTGYVFNNSNPGSIGIFALGEVVVYEDFIQAHPGNAGVTANLLNALYNDSTLALEKIIEDILWEDYAIQQERLLQLTPQFKVVQYSLEKLDLLIHKELEDVMNVKNEGTIPFILGGYDHLKQDQVKTYTGYNVNSFYQMLGVTHDWKDTRWLACVSASESYMNLPQFGSKAKYNTVWAALGADRKSNRFEFLLDVLYGYSFLKTKRHMQFLSSKAKSDHGAWNISADLKLAYNKPYKGELVKPYDTVSFIYGRENAYEEKGANAANFYVFDENLCMIRNTLGLNLERSFSESIQIFLDAAWVYEYNFATNSYNAGLVGFDLYGTYKQTRPTHNYGRAHAGFKGEHKRLSWQLGYTGLFGNNFSENSLSGRLGYKF